MSQVLYISVGAIIGANLRYFVSLWVSERLGVVFPYGTFFVNISGCFVIGLFYGLGETRIPITPELRLFFAVGLLGAYTTFSSFGFETINLLRSGDLWLGMLNVAGSNVLGLLAVAVGLAVARLLS